MLGIRREIVDLARVAVGEAPEPPSHPVGADDGEPSDRRQVAEELGVRLPVGAAPVRRDDQRDGGLLAGPYQAGRRTYALRTAPSWVR